MYQIFAVNSSKQTLYENIGVARIKTFLDKRGIETEVTYLYQSEGVENELKKVDFNNKYFGFSFLYCYSDFIFELCSRIKEIRRDSVIFLGGRSVTDAYVQIHEDCADFDVSILGHGENPTYYCITELEKGRTLDEIVSQYPHLATSRYQENKIECYEHINNLEIPDRGYTQKNLTTASICTSHGCVGQCTFCSWKSTGAKWCGRPMKSVFDEIVSIYESCGIRDFTFNDGSFEDPGTLGKSRIGELCGYLEQYPVRFAFRFYLRAESFRDNDEDIALLKRMRKNGFITAFVGIESGCNEDLKTYNKRATVEDNFRIFRLLKEADIDMLYGFIMMNPYSTLETLRANYDFLRRNRCYHLFSYVNVLDVFYNTAIYDRVKSDNLLLPTYRYNRTSHYRNFNADTEPIKAFLVKNFNDETEIMRNYWEFYNFINYFHFIKVIHNEVYIKNVPAVEEMENRLRVLLENYFENLFVDFDIAECQNRFNEFADEVNSVYLEIRKLKLYIMKQVRKVIVS